MTASAVSTPPSSASTDWRRRRAYCPGARGPGSSSSIFAEGRPPKWSRTAPRRRPGWARRVAGSWRAAFGSALSTPTAPAFSAPTARSAQTAACELRAVAGRQPAGSLLRAAPDPGGDRLRGERRYRRPPKPGHLSRSLVPSGDADGEALPARDRAAAAAGTVGTPARPPAGVDPAGEAAPGGSLRRLRALRAVADRPAASGWCGQPGLAFGHGA